MNYSPQEIIVTIRMVQAEHLDIRTVAMGISLLDSADEDPDAPYRRIYEKIMARAGRLVPVCETIEKKLGIPIVHKRIAVTPIHPPRRPDPFTHRQPDELKANAGRISPP
jgi:uncharacterized protein (UPF0210 family)